MIKYTVYRADWLAEGTGEFDYEGWEMMKPSAEIDSRTERSVSFDTLEAATKFAEIILKDRTGDRWFAKLEIRKFTIDLFKEYSIENELDNSCCCDPYCGESCIKCR